MQSNITTILTLLLALLLGSLSGQNRTGFSLLENSAAEIAMEDAPAADKLNRARKIYERLIDAKGDYRFLAPTLRLVKGEKRMAFLEGDGLSIGLEEKCYDILDEFGDAGLAFILGHELTHFYEKHAYTYRTFQEYDDKRLSNALKEAKSQMSSADAYEKLASEVEAGRKQLIKVAGEKEADYLGGFLAYSAGYDVQKGPDYFQALYDGYGSDEVQRGYLDLKQRKKMAEDARDQMNQFINVFELANLLTADRRYPDARLVYKYILQQYQGREVYNNLGVLTVLEALEYFSDEEKKYRLPLELDLEFSSATRDVVYTDELRRSLLEEALRYFNSAIGLDDNYATAYLNMACVYYLLDDVKRANFYAATEAAARVESGSGKSTANNIQNLLALLDIKAGKQAEAEEKLNAIKDVSALAQTNLSLLKGEALPQADPEFADYQLRFDIDGVRRSRELTTMTQNTNGSELIKLFKEVKLRNWKNNNSSIYLLTPPESSGRTEVTYMITNPDYPDKTRMGFGVGSAGEEIVTKFGQPIRKLVTSTGEIWVYEHRILMMDKAKKLQRWVIKN